MGQFQLCQGELNLEIVPLNVYKPISGHIHPCTFIFIQHRYELVS